MKNVEFTYIGKTKEEKIIGCIGIWNFYQTNGLPIACQIDKLWESGIVISWLHEYNIALWKGANEEKLLKIIEEELGFSKYYNKQEVLNKLTNYISQRETPTPLNYTLLIESQQIADQ